MSRKGFTTNAKNEIPVTEKTAEEVVLDDAGETEHVAEEPVAKPLPQAVPFGELPSDHPIHLLARRIYEGEGCFDAFHMIRADGVHLIVDINRFVGPEAVTNSQFNGQLKPVMKLQTGNMTPFPELGRAADWYAKATAHAITSQTGLLNMRDGTHAVFLRNLLHCRVKASVHAFNSEHQAAFADALPIEPGTTVNTPFLIEASHLRRYILEQINEKKAEE